MTQPQGANGVSVTQLRLRQFRSHNRFDLDVDPRPVAIYGANGAGKTNILEALSLLSPGRGLRRAKMADMALQGGSGDWSLSYGLDIAGDLRDITCHSAGGAARQLRIDDKAASQLQLGGLLRVLWLIPAMDRLWLEGAEGRRRFLDRASLSFHPAHAEASLTYERAMRERNRLLRDQVQEGAWYKALESQMAEAAVKIEAHRRDTLDRLRAQQADDDPDFPAADLTLHYETPFDGADLAAQMADNRRADLAAGRSLIGPHRADLLARYRAKDMAAKDCSTGEQKALLLSLILANARALRADTGRAPLLLLDEVAAHLDPNRRARLYDQIAQDGTQAWMTGTDPALFDTLGPRAQFFELCADGLIAHP